MGGQAQYSKIKISCPLCDATGEEVVLEPWVEVEDPIKLYGAASSLRGTQRLVRCTDCDLVYENPRYPADVILAGYAASEEGGHDSQHPMRRHSFARALEKLAPRLPKPGARVLDIGTAGGAFLEAAQQFGYQAVGLEPSRYLVDSGRERGLEIVQGSIDDLPFEAASFDMVTMWDVLEHLTDPRQALTAIAEFLKPGGILLINYPDIGTLQARLAGSRYWWILSGHVVHFAPKTLRELCRRTGFEAFHFQRYWQVLQFGYLEDIAIHLQVPMSRLMKKLTPGFLQRMAIPYYASQTTALARRSA